MPTFSGVMTDFTNTTKGFSFKIAGTKYTFHGNNIQGFKDGDGVTGVFKEESFPDKQDPTRIIKWKKAVEISHSTNAAPAATQPQAASSSSAKGNYRGFGQSGGFPVAADSYERCTLRRDCVRDAVAALVGKGDKPDASVVISYAKELEAYVSGEADTKAAKSAIDKLTETEE